MRVLLAVWELAYNWFWRAFVFLAWPIRGVMGLCYTAFCPEHGPEADLGLDANDAVALAGLKQTTCRTCGRRCILRLDAVYINHRIVKWYPRGPSHLWKALGDKGGRNAQ